MALELSHLAPPAYMPLILASLGLCFLGYVAFRIQSVLNALSAGVFAGAAAAMALRPEPTGAEYLVACMGCALVLGLIAWFAWRAVLALQMAVAAGALGAGVCLLLTGSAAAAVEAVAAGTPGAVDPAAWVVGGLGAVLVGGLTFALARRAVMVLTALLGAAGATLGATLMVMADPLELVRDPGAHGSALLLLLVVTGLLLVCGLRAQQRLGAKLDAAFAPPKAEPKKDKDGKDAKGKESKAAAKAA